MPLLDTLEQRENDAIAAAGGLRAAASRSASLAGAMSVVTQLVLVLVYVALARLTTPEVFGVFAAGSVLLSLGEMLSESGMTAALLQERDHVEEAAATALASTVSGGILLGLIALALSVPIGLFFHSREIGLVAAVISGSLVINGITSVPATLLQRRFALRRWLVEPVATTAFGAVSAIGLAAGWGAWGLVAGWYAAATLRAAAYWLASGWRPRRQAVSWALWRHLARFARHILAGQLLAEIQRVASTALIGRYLGPRDLGEFRFGWRMVSQVSAPVLAANAYTIQPALVRVGDEPARVRAAVLTSFRIVSLVALPLGALFVPFGSTLAVVILGNSWQGVGPIVVLLGVMGMAQGLLSVPIEIFKARRRPEIIPRVNAIWATTSLALMAALLPFGARGIACAWSASTFLAMLYALNRVCDVAAVKRYEIVATILPPLTASALAVGSVYALDWLLGIRTPQSNLGTLSLLLGLLFGALVYLAAIALLAWPTLHEAFSILRTVISRRPSVPDATREAR